jgi:hypothetical protein
MIRISDHSLGKNCVRRFEMIEMQYVRSRFNPYSTLAGIFATDISGCAT